MYIRGAVQRRAALSRFHSALSPRCPFAMWGSPSLLALLALCLALHVCACKLVLLGDVEDNQAGGYSVFHPLDARSDHRVLIIYSGGTIGMEKNKDGVLAPSPGFLTNLLKKTINFNLPQVPQYTVMEYDPLLDSSNMTQNNWYQIAMDIYKEYDNYDGFVVIHGTDTLAYTASALSFLLLGSRKPIVVTGSQIPMSEPYNDGLFNLLGSLIVAGDYRIPETMVFFNNKLMRGNRTQKRSATNVDAFDSVGYRLLGWWGTSVNIDDSAIEKNTTFELSEPVIPSSRVSMVILQPSGDASFLREMISGVRGAVIIVSGISAPTEFEDDLLQVFLDAKKEGIVLVCLSGAHSGLANQEIYSATRLMKKYGCVDGFDMTPEAAFTKLSWLLSKHREPEVVRERMVEAMCGEISPSQEERSDALSHERWLDV